MEKLEKCVDLRLAVSNPPPVNQTVVETLQHFLALAEKGEIVGIAIAVVHEDGSTGYGFECGGHEHHVNSAVATLAYRLNRGIYEDAN